MRLIAAGIGVGILPLERRRGILVYGRTQVRPLKPRLMRALSIVRRRERNPDPAIQVVLEAVRTLSKNKRTRPERGGEASP